MGKRKAGELYINVNKIDRKRYLRVFGKIIAKKDMEKISNITNRDYIKEKEVQFKNGMNKKKFVHSKVN